MLAIIARITTSLQEQPASDSPTPANAIETWTIARTAGYLTRKARDMHDAAPGYTPHTMTIREALASPSESIRQEAATLMRKGLIEHVTHAAEAYTKAVMDEQITIFVATVN